MTGTVLCRITVRKSKKISKKLLTNPQNGRTICNNKNTKEEQDMFANKFYYFYYFNMGCPSFVNTEH